MGIDGVNRGLEGQDRIWVDDPPKRKTGSAGHSQEGRSPCIIEPPNYHPRVRAEGGPYSLLKCNSGPWCFTFQKIRLVAMVPGIHPLVQFARPHHRKLKKARKWLIRMAAFGGSQPEGMHGNKDSKLNDGVFRFIQTRARVIIVLVDLD